MGMSQTSHVLSSSACMSVSRPVPDQWPSARLATSGFGTPSLEICPMNGVTTVPLLNWSRCLPLVLSKNFEPGARYTHRFFASPVKSLCTSYCLSLVLRSAPRPGRPPSRPAITSAKRVYPLEPDRDPRTLAALGRARRRPASL
jgi:hypothetical protein